MVRAFPAPALIMFGSPKSRDRDPLTVFGVWLRFALQVGKHLYLTQSVFKVVLQRLIPAQILQLILHISNSKG